MTLTSAQLKHLEERLRDERDRALRALNRSVAEHSGSTEQDRSGDLTSMPLHTADVGTDNMQQEIDAANATRVSREIAEIDAALERLYRSPESFGISESTGTQIPFERLEAVPWATS